MKKSLSIGLICIFIFYVLVSCTSQTNYNFQDVNKIKIGVTSIPHGEILQNIKKIFNANFEIINYIDYDSLNEDLVNGKIDANFFQTREYMNRFNLDRENKIIEVAAVHVEPLIIYSSRYKSIDKVEDGDIVYIPNDFINRNRALKVLESAGLVELEEDFNSGAYIIKNFYRELVINEVSSNEIPVFFNSSDLIILNTNIALENNIDPKSWGIFYEESFEDDSKYNIFVTREDMRTSIEIKQIANYLNSYENFKFITQKYNGFIKPVF